MVNKLISEFRIQNSKFKVPTSAQAGYTLVALVMVIAVMSIMMAAAVEIVSFQAQREREAELIFRGEQYVEAIRLYRQKYGRYPMRMKELWEADPRVLRREWKDPITGSEEWGLVFLGQEGQQLAGPGPGRRSPLDPPRPQATGTPAFGDRPGGGEPGPGGGGERVGPIIGVHSLSKDASIKIYKGRATYDTWEFVYNEADNQDGSGGPQPTPDNQDPWGSPPTPVPPPPGPTGTPTY